MCMALFRKDTITGYYLPAADRAALTVTTEMMIMPMLCIAVAAAGIRLALKKIAGVSYLDRLIFFTATNNFLMLAAVCHKHILIAKFTYRH